MQPGFRNSLGGVLFPKKEKNQLNKFFIVIPLLIDSKRFLHNRNISVPEILKRFGNGAAGCQAAIDCITLILESFKGFNIRPSGWAH